MAISGLRSWHNLRVDANLTFLPQTLDLSPSRIGAVLLMLFGGFWIGVTIMALGGVTSLPRDDLIFLAGATVIGAGVILWGLSQLFRRHHAVLSADGVEVTERSLFGAKAWYEPYGAFQGVLHRRVVIRSKNHTRTYQVIELLHDDRDKSVPLYVRRSSEMPRSRWEGYAARLKLPALEMEDGALLSRAPGDLDKSLREQVAEGTVSHAFDPDAPAPDGLVVTRDHANAFTIAITAPRFPLWFLSVFVLVGAGLVVAAFLGGEKPMLMLGVGLLFGGVPLYMLYRDRTSARSLKIERDRLILDDEMRSRRRGPESMSFDEIESIRLRAEDGNLGKELVIAGDRDQIKVGSGLSREALDWLKNFLTAAIATA